MYKLKTLAGIAALAMASSTLAALPAYSAPDGSNVVINEVYVRGGSKDGVYRDYVELYNPTSEVISLDGMSLQYFSASGTNGKGTTPLSGTIAPNSYYLVLGADVTHTTELQADAIGGINASGSKGTLILFASTDTQTITAGDQSANTLAIDTFGWGSSASFETAPDDGATFGEQSYSRVQPGVDTNNNSADFVVGAPSPQASQAGGTTASDPNPGTETPSDPAEDTPATQLLTIAEIQGTGSETPYNGQTVTTRGIVTAVYPSGGFGGAYIQTPGTGGDQSGTDSDGIFVFSLDVAGLAKGTYVEVEGEATEYFGLTQVKASRVSVLEKTAEVRDPAPVVLDAVPTDEAAREALEGMLIDVTGTYTVTNNYDTNTYGQVELVYGNEPLRQPSDVFNPNEDLAKIRALNEANTTQVITLDDGISYNYTSTKDPTNQLIPLAWLSVDDPLRVGSQMTFKQPMILDYRHQWNIQPTEPVNVAGANDPAHYIDNSDKWIEISGNERPAAPADLGGDVTVSSFNVLNYFTALGVDEEGCRAYVDRDGDGVTANGCDVRGAYGSDDLARQQAKIVAAINALDSSVVGLEEIENSAQYGRDRDAALATLVDALNDDAGFAKWAFVPTPSGEGTVPTDEDVIRLAFIYQKAEVAAVGPSMILTGNEYFTGLAREPLAQRFTAIDGDGQPVGTEFVAVVNHFKSKGSLSTKFAEDTDPYQGNNNQLRVAQATALADWIAVEFARDPVVILGDLNSYSAEDPIRALENRGFTNIATNKGVTNHSYQYAGLVGSLDHALGNAAAMALVTGADVWNVNAMEPIAFEYSRYNYNVKVNDLFDMTPYRSSDHDPIKVGLNVVPDAVVDSGEVVDPAEPGTTLVEEPGSDHGSTLGTDEQPGEAQQPGGNGQPGTYSGTDGNSGSTANPSGKENSSAGSRVGKGTASGSAASGAHSSSSSTHLARTGTSAAPLTVLMLVLLALGAAMAAPRRTYRA
ncbi:MAG: ExeM/NucH family extracellular endonuclease [Actinomycetaceae bacterium]|nr:ExeM/NucH family extracellular endonuclease [Arcanobacterium sp.]MDD7504374.1 ExeM/NucH family extracellular endonuclease [Actinomycetaceae bacterium]MDY6143038.1 ExeM/NucH family extracellular endonuclease [Arcanobacterium sp.]